MHTSVDAQSIQQKIFIIRGQKVMLDRDLAKLYGIETKVLNQAVKRNMQRFLEFHELNSAQALWEARLIAFL